MQILPAEIYRYFSIDIDFIYRTDIKLYFVAKEFMVL